MQSILRIFSGQAQLETAPAQVFESTTTGIDRSTTTSGKSTATTQTATTTTTDPDEASVTTTTLPLVAVEEQEIRGIVPPKDVKC